ncbi:Golgin candidate 5 [Sarracenia purpurea var. burkii]
MAFMGQKGGESIVESVEKPESLQPASSVGEKEGAETDSSKDFATELTRPAEEGNEESSVLTDTAEGTNSAIVSGRNAILIDPGKSESADTGKSESADPGKSESGKPEKSESDELSQSNIEHAHPDSLDHLNQAETSVVGPSEDPEFLEAKPGTNEADHVEGSALGSPESQNVINLHEINEQRAQEEEIVEHISSVQFEDAVNSSQDRIGVDLPDSVSLTPKETKSPKGHFSDNSHDMQPPDEAAKTVSESAYQENDTDVRAVDLNQQVIDYESEIKEQRVSSESSVSDIPDSVAELEKLKREMKMMETALQGAARQAQAKADEIAKLMNENEHLKAIIEDLKKKSNEAEIEILREEYHQRVATLERKVYALTKERDTLRREQSKKSDAAALLKEKDEIINQVMAEGEELSKKQAAQESHIRKLRAQIRELEEEKKGLTTKLQVEENKVESIKRDKAATETLLQETIEKHQAELAAQKEFYADALHAAKKAEALAEARANNEARTELDSRLREAEERETMLVQALEELRQTLSRKEQQFVFREDMLRRDIEDLQKRYQASERWCEELVTQVPESTRPLLRQIEAMQETTARRAEAWAAVERSLNLRLQISCLTAEQTQLSQSLEKERQRAAENRQDYLAAKEEADTFEGHVSQLEEEIREFKRKHKQELQEALTHQELL